MNKSTTDTTITAEHLAALLERANDDCWMLARELEGNHGLSGIDPHKAAAIKKAFVADYLMQEVIREVGGEDNVAYLATEADATFMQRVFRRAMARAQDGFECATAAINRSKAKFGYRARGMYLLEQKESLPSRQARLEETMEPIAKAARKHVTGSLDGWSGQGAKARRY